MNTLVPYFTNMAVAASKYVQKYNKSPKVASKDEFFVSTTNIIAVAQYKEKIEKMYDIKIQLEEPKSDEGQWLILEGESVDRRNAKNYINAICNPAEKKQVQFPTSSCSELTDPVTLEHIEKQTNAFIRPLKKIAQFEISGTELAVTLAFSQIEELAGSAVEGDEQFDDCEDTDDGQSDGIIKISPATHNGSSRLNSILERALSANSDGICSVEDYRHTRPSVQRVLVSCLQNEDDIDDDMLFADGKVADSSPKGSNLMMYFENSGDDKPNSSIEVDGETQIVTKEQTSPGVGAFTDKLTELSIGKSKEPSSLLTKQQEYLRNFGLTVGFKEKDVDTAINFVNEKTRPSDFLDLLNNLPKDDDNDSSEHHESTANISRDSGDDVVILSTETVDLVSGETTIVHETKFNSINVPGKSDATIRQNQASNGSLPDWYKERLLQDFMSEDENCSVEELKKRNAERQRLLRENFEKQQNQPDGQTKGKSKNRNKNRNKKKKKQNQQQQQQSEADNVDNSERREKQFRIDVGENESRTYSSDGEQTCVLRVWSADQDLSNAGSGPNKTCMGPNKTCMGPSNADIVQATPKRKNCNGRNNNQQQIPPLLPGLENFNQQQNFSNGAGPAGNQWSQVKGQNEPQGRGQGYGQYVGPIGRGFHVKPTQVVTPSPVNLAQGNNAGMLAPGSAASKPVELRYIVIDGSNVAMTHGNGKYFSCKGIKLCVDYFRQRGHENITVFVPQWRQYKPSDDNPILDQNILHELKQEDILVFTPSRRIGRKLVVAYDDRFVLELAEAEDAVIVSNDQYRDLMMEKVAWRKIIETRLLMYSFVKDRFMPPNDPLGREGPCLDEFLQVTKKSYNVNRRQYNGYNQQKQPQQHYHQQQQHQYHQPQQQQQYQQPQGHGIFHQGQDQQNQGHFNQGQGHYAKAARYGLNKQENNGGTPNKSGNRFKPLSQQANDPQQFDEADGNFPRTPQGKGQWRNAPKGQGEGPFKNKGAPRSEEETEDLYKELKILFPEEEQEEKIRSILINHNSERDLMKLTNYLMSVLFDA